MKLLYVSANDPLVHCWPGNVNESHSSWDIDWPEGTDVNALYEELVEAGVIIPGESILLGKPMFPDNQGEGGILGK